MPTSVTLKTQACPACEHLQELPAIFCQACGSPLAKVSKLFVTLFLTVTVAAYMIYGLYVNKLSWPAPLYLYYVFIFVCFSLIVTRRYRIMSFRVMLWCLLLVYATWILWLSVSSVLTYVTSDLTDLLNIIEQNKFSQMTVLGLTVVLLLLSFVVLVRRFKFTLAYRIFATFLALAALGLRYAFSYSVGETGVAVSPKLSDWFLWAPETTVKELFEMLSLNIMRALVAEMAIYSFIKSHTAANDHFKRIAANMSAPAAGNPTLQAASQVTRALIRTGLYAQHFMITFAKTIGNYLWGLYRTFRRIMLDLILPIAALSAAAFLMGILAEHSAAYITGQRNPKLLYLSIIRSPLVMMLLAILGVFAAQMVFLQTVTKFSARALWRCNTLLLLWVAPFFFAFFVFTSLSLIISGGVLKRWGHDSFPYRFGPLTGAAGFALLVLVAFAMLHARKAPPPAAALAATHPENDIPATPPDTTTKPETGGAEA